MQGIYKIINNKNDKVYIGSSKNIIKRQKKSEKEIKKQRYYNLYNEFKNNIFIPFNSYEYNETYLYGVISAMEYFKKNFNTNDYYIEIVQYKSDVTLYVVSKTGNIIALYEYNTKYKTMMIGNKHYYSYIIKNKNVPNERYVKFINIMQCKNRIIGILNKIIQLDDTITQYNTCKYIKNKYEYMHKIIKEFIGYNYNNFYDHILRDDGVLTYATSNNIKFEHGKIIYEVS